MRFLFILLLLAPLSGQGEAVRLETERAILFSVTEKHAPFLHARLYSNPRVMKKYGGGTPFAYEKTQRRVRNHAKRWKEGYPFSGFIALSKKGRHFIGYVICGNSHEAGYSEIVYLISEKHWGQGWGTELVTALVEDYLPDLYAREANVLSGEGFEEHPLLGVVATVREDHSASYKILERLGFKWDKSEERYGALRKHYRLTFNPL